MSGIWDWPGQCDGVGESHRISLGEGHTPLVRARRVGRELGLNQLFFKLEGCNPTGSYKDRFAARAVAGMMANGQTRVVATSSGNTGAALAAYCAAAGMTCEIAIVEGAPEGKLLQMSSYGATLRRIVGFGSDPAVSAAVFGRLREMAQTPGTALQVSAYTHSPFGMTGVETVGLEIHHDLSGHAEHVFVPAGGGGLTVAVARGLATTSTAIHCVQPAGNDTIASPLRQGASRARSVHGTSQISGLQVPDVIDGDLAISECRRSGGTGHVVEDDEVWELQARLAREEGVFTEPAGAVSVAGALRAVREGFVNPGSPMVCIITGTGFKDTPSLERMGSRTTPTMTLEEFLTSE